ncbi:MAG TPA: fibronectin type III domain-containing protein [Tepidisphaeraceae bacterium]
MLEQRQLLAARPLGELPGGFSAELFTERSTDYRFSVSGAVQLNAWVGVGTATILDDKGKPLASGRKLSHVLGTGSYTLQANAPSNTVLQIGTKRVPAVAPSQLKANAWGSGSVQLHWFDNADTEVQYRVDRWTKQGWRRSVRVGENMTAAVIDKLPAGSRTTYRVSAVSANGGSVRSLNTVTAQTLTEDTSGWYKVDLSGATKGETSQSMVSDTLKIWPPVQDNGDAKKSKWVYAGSWQAAVWQSVGAYKMENGQAVADPVKTKKSGGDDVTFPFGNGDFRIGTAAELKAQAEATAGNVFDIGGGDQKMIVLEDSYGQNTDYDDFYWKLEIASIRKFKIEKSLSGQIPGDHNYSGHSGGVDSFILMGTSSNDSMDTRFDLSMSLSSPEIKDELSFAYENKFVTDNPRGGTTITDYDIVDHTWSGNRVSLTGAIPYEDANTDYTMPIRMVAGFDQNGDDVLSADEVIARDTTIFRIVDQQSYDAAQSALAPVYAVGGPLWGYEFSSNWLYSFVNNLDFKDAVSSSATVSASSDFTFDHYVGANFDVANNSREHKFSTATGSALPAAIMRSPEMVTHLRAAVEDNKAALVAAGRALPVNMVNGVSSETSGWIGPFTLKGQGNSPLSSVAFASGDLYYALNNTRISGERKVWFKVNHYVYDYGVRMHRISVSDVKADLVVSDLYDFQYTREGETALASKAAVVQAGRSTLGMAGNVRVIKVNIADAVPGNVVTDSSIDAWDEEIP